MNKSPVNVAMIEKGSNVSLRTGRRNAGVRIRRLKFVSLPRAVALPEWGGGWWSVTRLPSGRDGDKNGVGVSRVTTLPRGAGSPYLNMNLSPCWSPLPMLIQCHDDL